MNRRASDYIFTTEGHIIKLDPTLRVKPWERDAAGCFDDDSIYAVARTNESFITHSVSQGTSPPPVLSLSIQNVPATHCDTGRLTPGFGHRFNLTYGSKASSPHGKRPGNEAIYNNMMPERS